MMKSCGVKASKIWMNFIARRTDGTVIKFIAADLTDDRYEDFIDFAMKHYVTREFQHIISGLPRDPDGMAEYRNILSNVLRRPGYVNTVVYRDEATEKPEIVCAATMYLKTIDNPADDMLGIQPQNKALQRYFQIAQQWEDHYPSTEVMRKYDVDQYYDDRGICVCADYQRLGIAQMILRARPQICKEHGVPMTGAWMTSRSTEKAATSAGWNPAYEVTSQQMEQVLGLTLPDSLPSFKYMVCKAK